jgi:hypothetical protein
MTTLHILLCRPAPSHSVIRPWCAGRESNPHVTKDTGSWDQRGCHYATSARERPTGFEPALQPWQGCVLTAAHYGRMEPPAGTDPAASSVPRTCSAIELRRHELAALESDQDFRGQSAVGCRYPIGHWSRYRVPPPASRPYRGRPVVGPSGMVRSSHLPVTCGNGCW